MKKNIPIWMLAIAAMMPASCSQNDELLQTDTPTDGEVQVSFSVRTPGMQTRATVPTVEDEGKATRYICEVYEGNNAADLTGNPTRFEQAGADFTLLLKKNTDYVFLLWADHGTAADGTEEGNYYNADDLKNVQVAGGTADKCDQIAFYACKSLTVTSTGSIDAITLNHAVAKVNLYETGLIMPGSTLDVEYTPAQAFNVAAGTTTAAAESRTLSYTLTDGVPTVVADGGKDIARFYVLAPEKGKADGLGSMTFNLSESDGTPPQTTSKSIDNVPLQANYVTNIRGEFSDYASTSFSVSLTNTWEEGTTYDLIDMADFTTDQQYKDYFQKQGGSGTLKIIGDMTDENLTTIRDALKSSEFSYVIDLSGAKITDTQLPNNMFQNAVGIRGVILPEGITATGYNVFNGASNLESVKFPTSLERVGDALFFGCSKLESVNLDETKVTDIPGGTFLSCGALERIALGNVKTIHINTFTGCSKLKELDLSKCTQAPSINSDSFNMVNKTNLKVYVKTEELKTEFLTKWSATDSQFTADNFVVKQ